MPSQRSHFPVFGSCLNPEWPGLTDIDLTCIYRSVKLSSPEDILKPNPNPAIDIESLKLNLGALEDELAECVGFLSEAFLEDAPGMLAAIEENIEQANADQVRFQVHTLKSSSATLGAIHLSQICLALETQARSGDLSQAQALSDAMQVEFQRVKHELGSLASQL